MRTQWITTGAFVLACALAALAAPPALAGETAPRAKTVTAADCGGRAPVGYLGITSFECMCTQYIRDNGDSSYWYFRSEPKVLKVDPDGACAGIVEPGDRIVALAGAPITTRAAGLHFSYLEAGVPVALTLRRSGALIERRVVPQALCPDDPRVAGSGRRSATVSSSGTRRLAKRLEEWAQAPAAPTPPPPPVPPTPSTSGVESVVEAPRPPQPPEAPAPPELSAELSLLPQGWMGMGTSCARCTIEMHGGQMEWHFGAPPKVYTVDEGGPADRAGLQAGDVLLKIDGVAIDTPEGGHRFSTIQPGDTVTWTVRRGKHISTVAVEAEASPTPRAPTPPTPPIPPQVSTPGTVQSFGERKLRFNGHVGNTRVTVYGLGSVVVTTDEETGEIVIETGDATIRVKREK